MSECNHLCDEHCPSHLTLIKDFRPKGHAYFRDAVGRVHIADTSGTLPDDTDDGDLILDTTVRLRIDQVSIPLKNGGVALASGAETQFVLDLFGVTRIASEARGIPADWKCPRCTRSAYKEENGVVTCVYGHESL
jgi:hypothetical protein